MSNDAIRQQLGAMADERERAYQQLLADVRAARDAIEDTPHTRAGFVALDLLDNLLERHAVKGEPVKRTRADRKWCPGCVRYVPATHMRQHEGNATRVDLPECKTCLMRKRK